MALLLRQTRAAATTGMHLLASIHGEAIRLPIEIIAVIGSVIDLYAIWRVGPLPAERRLVAD